MNRLAHGAMTGLGVIVHEGGLRTGVVILLEHVHDGIVHRITCPLGIEGGIAVDSNCAADCLCQCFVGKPTCKSIPVTGRDSTGDCLLRSVRHSNATHIAAAIGFIGQDIILAGIVDGKLLAGNLSHIDALSPLQSIMVKGLDGGGHIAVQDAVDVLP